MKRFILLFVSIAFSFVILAQTAPDVTISKKINYGYYPGKTTDTINGTTTADAVFYIEQAIISKYQLSYMVSGDTLNGCSGNVTIQPQGSYDGVTYTNIGSSVTWTTTADYDGNNTLNTYTTLASGTQTNAEHTETIAAFVIAQDSATAQLNFADTVRVPTQTKTVAAQTITDARTVTITTLGCDYRYIKILLTGASGARVELQAVAVKVTPIVIPGL